MKQLIKNKHRSAFAALLVLTGAVAAQSTQNFRDKVTAFDNLDAIRKFEIDGVSLVTPWDRIPKTLIDRGYCELDPGKYASSYRRFLRSPEQCLSPPRPPRNGDRVGSLQVTNTNGARAIEFGGSVMGDDPQVLSNSEAVRWARELKQLFCAGIKDPTERHQYCPPNKDNLINLTPRGHKVLLAGKLAIAIRATPQSTRISIEEVK